MDQKKKRKASEDADDDLKKAKKNENDENAESENSDKNEEEGDVEKKEIEKASDEDVTNNDKDEVEKEEEIEEKEERGKNEEEKKEEDKQADPEEVSKETSTEQEEKKNAYYELKFCIIQNDDKPDSCVKLIGLKSLFAKQLPKMPRAYIARLVFDRRHKSLAILSDDPQHKGGDEEIVGAICYRGFYEMRFAEIAFCAVNSTHQVKGYGTKLMNLLKRHAVLEGIEYFITYADNYAIGYFKKQGFTKTISMSKGRYNGLIKDYDGGTPMECYIHPSIDFTRIPEMIKAQRVFILDRIRLKAKSHLVSYSPLPKDFKPNLEGVSRVNEPVARAMAIPGVAEAGWTMADVLASTSGVKDADRQKNVLKSELLAIVRKTEEQQFSWPFREPVDTSEVHDYLDVIKEPIDLSTIEKRIKKGDYYKEKQMLYRDLMLMVNNCKLYNDENSGYYECAVSLEKFLKGLFQN